jgi:hypothetical protein
MIRNGSIKITGIGAAFRRYKESMALSAICLQWSDGGTTDYSPGWFATEEENRYWIDLKNGERITPKVSASNSFIESLQYKVITYIFTYLFFSFFSFFKVLRDKKSLPEKGDWNVQGKSVDMCSYKKVVSHQELYRTTFFDGLKANAIYMTDKDDPDDDLPIITELQFKMSTFVDDGCGRFVWQQPMRDVDAECDEIISLSMPYDISILCSDNNIVKGHKFVLAYHSLFFRAKFNPNGGGKLKGGTSEKVVNLKDFTFATGVLMTIIIDIMYDHWPERLLPISTILGLFYLSDLLIMDNDWMSKLWTAALTCVRGNLDFTLKVRGYAPKFIFFR